MRLHLMIAFLSIGFSGFLPAQEVSPGSGTGVRGGNIEGDQPQVRDSSGKKKGDDGQDRGTASRGMVQQWLRQMDSDQDQQITLKESRGLMQKNFSRVDANSDGAIDVRELTTLAQRLMQNRRTRRPGTNQSKEVADEKVQAMAGEQLVCELNVTYRPGHARWKLDLFRPAKASDRLRPAIVFVHGGGWVSGDKRSALFLEQAIAFAKLGYVCVTVNYRLDPARRPCVEDVKCAVRWLRAHAKDYQIDPRRIGGYGNSAGAHLVSMLGVSAGKLEGDGPFQDFSSRLQAVAASATPTRPSGRGLAESERAALAPITYVSMDAPPFLLFHEASDRVVDIGHSDDFVKALKSAGATDVTYRRMTDGSGHAVYQRNRKDFQAQLAGFFDRTLRNRGPADAAAP